MSVLNGGSGVVNVANEFSTDSHIDRDRLRKQQDGFKKKIHKKAYDISSGGVTSLDQQSNPFVFKCELSAMQKISVSVSVLVCLIGFSNE